MQQLETEAAVMQMQDHARQLQDNAAYSDSDSQSPTGQRAQLVTPLRELREANCGTSASWAGAAAEDRPSRGLSLPHRTASKGARATSSPLRRGSNDGRAELPGPQAESRQDLRRASSASVREPGSASHASAPAPEALPCMRRNRSSSRAESSGQSSHAPDKRPQVCAATIRYSSFPSSCRGCQEARKQHDLGHRLSRCELADAHEHTEVSAWQGISMHTPAPSGPSLLPVERPPRRSSGFTPDFTIHVVRL